MVKNLIKQSAGLLRHLFWWRRLKGYPRLFAQVITASFILVVGVWFITDVVTPQYTHAAWFNENWAYRKAINVSAHTSAEINVYLNLTGGNALNTSDTTRFQADCGDLRFTDGSGNLLPYYIVSGCGTATTVIHIFVQGFPAGAQTFYYYYGNPSAANGFSSSDFVTGATGVTLAYASEEISPTSSAYWSLDEGTGSLARDSSSYGTNAALTATTWSSSCISGNCLVFNGSSSQGSVATTVPGVKTIAFWVYMSSNTTNELIKLNGTTDVRATSGVVSAPGSTSPTVYVNANQTTAITQGSWNYVVVTTSTAISASTILLGSGPAGVLDGKLDEIKFYPYVLSTAQIQANFNARGSQQGSGLVAGSSTQSSINQGLLGYWKMDDASSPMTDSSGNGHNGTLVGATTTTAGKFNGGAYFDGVGANQDLIDLSATNDFQITTGSIAVWFYKMGACGGVHVCTIFSTGTDSNQGYSLDTDPGNGDKFRFNIKDQQNVLSTVNPSDNQWYYVVATFDGSTVKIYINGALDTTEVQTTAIGNWSPHAYIGNGNSNKDLTMNGVLDEMRIYNRVISAGEVNLLYSNSALFFGALGTSTSNGVTGINTAGSNYCVPGDTTTSICKPVGEWRFEEGQGTTANDTSDTNYDGTLVNSTYWTRGKIGGGLAFDGSLSGSGNATYVDAGSGAALEVTTFTASAWVYLTGVCGAFTDCTVLAKGTSGNNGFSFGLSDTGGNQVFNASMNIRDNQTAMGSVVIQPNTWYFISGTVDGTNIRLYVNGRLDSTTAQTEVPSYGGQPLTIGNRNSGLDLGFSGYIDEVTLYNYVRTPAQIAWDYNHGKPLINYEFDECQGTIAHDSMGNTNATISPGVAGTTAVGTCNTSSTMWGNGATGKFNSSIAIDNNDDTISASNALLPTGDFTYSAWIKPTTTSLDTVFGIGDGTGTNKELKIYFPSSSPGKIAVMTNNTTRISASTQAFSTSTWGHLVVKRSGSTISTYINGVRDATTGSDGTALSFSTCTLGIGSDNAVTGCTAATDIFNGQIDDVQIFNYPLTDGQVRNVYNQSASVRFGPLQGAP